MFVAFHRFLRLLPIVAALFAVSCGSVSTDSEPVSLPVPFSGSLTPNSVVVVASGQTSDTSTKGLFLNQVLGTGFPVFHTTGPLAGTLSFDFQNMSSPWNCGDKTCFTVPMTVFFSDGNFVRANTVQFYDFPYDPATESEGIPNSPPIEQFGPGAFATHGVASGYITSASPAYQSSVHQTLDYRYVHIYGKNGTKKVLEEVFFGTTIIHR